MAKQQIFSLIALIACLAALSISSAQAQDPVLPQQNRFSRFFSFEPMVDTGISELGGRRVYVHVPGLFDMKLDTRPNHQGARLDETILSGLVTVKLDRVRNADGTSSGPIDVRVMGLPMYRNEAARSGGLSSIVPQSITEITNITA